MQDRALCVLIPHESMLLTVVAANVVDADVEKLRLKFADDADGSSGGTGNRDFHKYWCQLLKESEVVADDAPKAPELVFAFMTCSYETSNSRTIAVAVRT